MITRIVQHARRRPMAISFTLLGVLIFLVGFRGEDTRQATQNIDRRVTVIESKSPCTDLTTQECAKKLYKALSEEQRRNVRDAVRREVARDRRLRETGRQPRSSRPSGTKPAPAPASPGVRTVPVPPAPGPTGSAPVPTPEAPQVPRAPDLPPVQQVAPQRVDPPHIPQLDLPPIGPLEIPPVEVPELPRINVPDLPSVGLTTTIQLLGE